MSTTLLDNETSTGAAVALTGGQYLFRAECSDWNGATLDLQIRGPNNTWIAVEDAQFTQNGATRVFLPGQTEARGLITGSPGAGAYADLVHFGF